MLLLLQAAEICPRPQNLALLRWMKEYKRQSRPSEYEAEFYAQCHETEDTNTGNISLPPLSSTRLPYHALVCGNARKIISECVRWGGGRGRGRERGGGKGEGRGRGRERVTVAFGGTVVPCP